MGNLRFRADAIRAGISSKQVARDLWVMCSRDPLFYVNTFVWTYDPRLPQNGRRLPFITYPFQDDTILEIIGSTGLIPGILAHDLLLEKSRDMGASWMAIIGHEWGWHFRDLTSFLWVSRKEELVDRTEDPRSLFWKALFILKNLPKFIRPYFEHNIRHLYNQENGSTIDGESTTGDVARGDRRTGILLDEFAAVEDGAKVLRSTGDATNNRLFNSTPKGRGNAFYTMVQSNVKKITLHWTLHPVKAAGLYTSVNGRLQVLDVGYQYPAGYKFILDGEKRSPWYDGECTRRASALEISQELDIDYHGSDAPFYDQETIQRCRERDIRKPYQVGTLEYDHETLKPLKDQPFVPGGDGLLQLWTHLDPKGRPPRDREYVIGVDVSAGMRSSNSVLAVGDCLTREKVAEFASPEAMSHQLAPIAVALGRWFCNENGVEAHMIWEDGGPGQTFGKCVLEAGYSNFYLRRNEKTLSKKQTDTPGWFSSKENKLSLLSDHRRALAADEFFERSAECVNEMECYNYRMDGGVAHSGASSTEDPSGAKHNHGDRVIGTSLMVRGMKDRTVKPVETVEIPENCFAARRERSRRRKTAEVAW